MLQQEVPEDFVTGRQASIRDFLPFSTRILGWGSIRWEGKGLDEVGYRDDTNQVVVRVDPHYFRPVDVNNLLGDSSKAKEKLGWIAKTSLEELVEEMITHDLQFPSKA